MPEIQPTGAPYPRSVLGWDGTNWRVMAVDALGHVQVDVLSNANLDDALETAALDRLRVVPRHDRALREDGVNQVLAQQYANNATVNVYTVPAATTFYLTSIHVMSRTVTVAVQAGYARIRDTTPAVVTIYDVSTLGSAHQQVGLNFIPPVELPTGWTIDALSGAATIWVSVAITGYEVT